MSRTAVDRRAIFAVLTVVCLASAAAGAPKPCNPAWDQRHGVRRHLHVRPDLGGRQRCVPLHWPPAERSGRDHGRRPGRQLHALLGTARRDGDAGRTGGLPPGQHQLRQRPGHADASGRRRSLHDPGLRSGWHPHRSGRVSGEPRAGEPDVQRGRELRTRDAVRRHGGGRAGGIRETRAYYCFTALSGEAVAITVGGYGSAPNFVPCWELFDGDGQPVLDAAAKAVTCHYGNPTLNGRGVRVLPPAGGPFTVKVFDDDCLGTGDGAVPAQRGAGERDVERRCSLRPADRLRHAGRPSDRGRRHRQLRLPRRSAARR